MGFSEVAMLSRNGNENYIQLHSNNGKCSVNKKMRKIEKLMNGLIKIIKLIKIVKLRP